MKDESELVVAENRRLLKEVRQLRARVDALESSRWWRLHPRFALRRLLPAQSHAEGASPSARVQSGSEGVDDLSTRFKTEVIERGSFSQDWFSGHIASWDPVLSALEGRPTSILELGSFEGMSACFFLWRLPEAHVTCVDTFAGSPEHSAMNVDVSKLEDAFDRNVSTIDGSRVTKIAGKSVDVLVELARSGQRFDVVYVDASHLALDVIVDASLAWPLLAADGVLIFDDYGWQSPLGEDPALVPGPAIDAFLGLVDRHVEVLSKGAQVIARKIVNSSMTETVAEPAHEAARGSSP